MEEVKLKVFVSIDNIYVTDAITAAGAEHTKDKNDADIIVCVMHCQAAVGQTSERDKEFKTFKGEVERHINEKINTPVVLVYTTMTGGREEDVDVTSRLEILGQELGIISLTVVRNSIQFELGQEELKQKLEQFRLAEQMREIMAAREARNEKQKVVTLSPPRRVEQPEAPQVEVVQPPRKKVFIDSNLPDEENVVILPKDENTSDPEPRPPTRKEKIHKLVIDDREVPREVIQKADDAEIILVIWRVGSYKKNEKIFQDFLNTVTEKYKDSNKKVIFAFDYGQKDIQRKKRLVLKDKQLALLKAKNLPDNFHICTEALDYVSGENKLEGLLKGDVSPVNRIADPQAAIAPVPVVQHASFFKYPEKRSFCHSRQFRNKYFEEHLKINEGDDESTKRKKLFLLFAHYKSLRHTILNIGHVDSWLSKKIEDELAKNLMEFQDYNAYKENKDKKRTSNLGKCFDPFAKKLEKLFLEKYPRAKSKEGHRPLLDNLIKLLSYADRRERRSFFNGPENQRCIENIIKAADLVYDKKIRPQVGDEAEKKPGVLPWYVQKIYDKAILSEKPKRPAVRI